MADARRTVRVRIEGRVQGVGFRAFVEREALAHGLDGWVRNRRDGGVETVIAGRPSDVEVVVARLRQGPPAARVDMVKMLDETETVGMGFEVLPTV